MPWLATYGAMPLPAATIPKQLGFLVGQQELHHPSYCSLLALHQAHCRLHGRPSFVPCVWPAHLPEFGAQYVIFPPFVLVISEKCHIFQWRIDPRWSIGMGLFPL